MSTLAVRLLGVPEIELDGVPVQLNRRHSLALLAYLIVTRGPHPRDELAALLSGDSSREAARKRLRNALADLTGNNLSDFLIVTRKLVEFNRDASVDVDVWSLDALHVADTSPTAAALDWSAERYGLEFLSGISLPNAPEFELWLMTERENLHQKLIRLAYQQSQQLFWSGDLEAGIELARRILSIEPWHEGAHRFLMQLLARNGQLAAALAQFDRCRMILEEELGVEPQPETTNLYKSLLEGPVAPRNNLTVSDDELGPLLGRKPELETVIRCLTEPSCRLFTIAGMGGVGKTSLALAAAARLATPAPIADEHPFADGIFMVDLASTLESNGHDPESSATRDRFLTVIGRALGLAFYGGIDRLDQIIAYLEPKRLLLLLDKLEPRSDEVPAIGAIIRGAPQVTVLVTSHTPLNIPEEWSLLIGGLSLPDSEDDLESAAASQLFLREAQRVSARIEPGQRPHIVDICRLVGGLPLALKVVAAWSAVLDCAEIKRELEGANSLLRLPNAQDNAISIQAVVAATFESMPKGDRQALRRLAIFSSQFSRASARAIGVDSDRLMTLSQRLLVEQHPDARFQLHPLIRQHALMNLGDHPDEEAQVRDLHAAHFSAFVAEQALRLSQDPDARAWIEAERANIRAAWSRAVDTWDVSLIEQMLDGLASWNELAGVHREWSDDLASAISRLGTGTDDPRGDNVLVRLIVANAEALLWQGELDRAFPLIAEARRKVDGLGSIPLEAMISACEGRLLRFRGGQQSAAVEALQRARVLAATAELPHVEANSLLQLSFAAVDNESYHEAESFLNRAEEAYQSIGDRLALCRVVQNRGRVNALLGDFIQAAIDLDQSLHMARQFGNRFVEGFSHMLLGVVSDSGYGRHREAEDHFNRTLEIVKQTGDPYLNGNLQRAIGRNALHSGDLGHASQCFEHALTLARDVNNSRAINESLRCLAHLACELGDLDAAVRLAQKTQRLSLDQGRRHAAASSNWIMGMAQERLGQLPQAELMYTQAYSTATELGITYLRSDAATGIASVALARGHLDLALARVEDTLVHLYEFSLAGCEEPGRTVRVCVDVLKAAGDSRADEVQAAGSALLEQRLMALPQDRRRQYLWSYPDRFRVLQERAGGEASSDPVKASDFRVTQALQ